MLRSYIFCAVKLVAAHLFLRRALCCNQTHLVSKHPHQLERTVNQVHRLVLVCEEGHQSCGPVGGPHASYPYSFTRASARPPDGCICEPRSASLAFSSTLHSSVLTVLLILCCRHLRFFLSVTITSGVCSRSVAACRPSCTNVECVIRGMLLGGPVVGCIFC